MIKKEFRFLSKDQKTKIQNYILLAISLLFYACGSPKYFLLLLVSIVVNIMIGLAIAKYENNKWLSRSFFIIGVVYNVSILLYYKYIDFIIFNTNSVFHTNFEAKNLILPLGLSFFTFKAISYLADIYCKKINVSSNPVYAALYLSFFAQVQSGPLSRYKDMNYIREKKPAFDSFSNGVYRFMIGFNKKILLANPLSNITQEIFSATSGNVSVAYMWVGAICYSIQLFFDFAGYSDMAIGISQMFGFECPENFCYPYMTASVSEFWRRWHITLGAWFRDYIYIPLGGSRVNSRLRLYINLFIVWLLTGLWHGASWNFVFWGLAYFVIIAFEKTTGLPDKLSNRFLKIIYRIFSLLFINFQWVIFRADGLRAGMEFIHNMFFAFNNPLANTRALFLLKDNIAFVTAGVLLCFPIIPWIEERCKKNLMIQVIYNVTFAVVIAALFLWAISFIVSGQNNPFAYANF